MFLKQLKISTFGNTTRDIPFHKGINLIVDESMDQVTGNNVGKTTVLKLIDFCLGADAKQIYIDPETKRDEYALVKDFLVDYEVIVTLVLSENIDNNAGQDIVIERNFLSYKKAIRRINNEDLTKEEFEVKLGNLIFPEHTAERPTFRQMISHNIRYKDEAINSTLKTLDRYTTDAEYEALYLFLLGCNFDKGSTRQEILIKIQQENTFKRRLEKQQTKNAYESALALVENEIKILNDKKSNLSLNENFESDLNNLNEVKYKINKLSSEIGKLNIRKDLINEAKQDLDANRADIDLQELQSIYKQATKYVSTIQKTFDELVKYHNQMTEEKIKFITKELPDLNKIISAKENDLKIFLSEEERFSLLISKSDSYEDLEDLISQLNEQFRRKGEYESVIQQLEEVETNLKKFTHDIGLIDDELFSETFEQTVKDQLNKFNKHFSSISNRLYGEQYALKYDIVTNKNGQKLYKFSSFNTNLSSGKKQGEISCFDIAYILFADEENIPCLHFILNDKKELMHDNQLVKIAEIVKTENIQFVASILKDKLPSSLNNEDLFVVKLSQDDKLFRIENKAKIIPGL